MKDKKWWQLILGQANSKLDLFPPWYQSYHRNFTATPVQQPLSEVEFTVFDTETTGLNPKTDRLLSIGAIRVRGNRILSSEVFGCYLDPEIARKRTEAISIHGLLPGSGSRNYLTEEAAIQAFLTWLGSDVLVAHHLGFDRTMIDFSLQRLGAGRLLNQGIDTVDLAKKLTPSGYWTPDDAFGLDHLARRFKIPLSDRHTAQGDSFITAVLLLKLLHRLAERRGRPLRLEDAL